MNDSPELIAAVRDIQSDVAREAGVSLAQLLGPGREETLVSARWLAMHIVRETTSASMHSIDRLFHRQRGATLYALRTIRDRISIYADVRDTAARWVRHFQSTPPT